VFRHLKKLHSQNCPFANLPESKKARRGEGLTADDMKKCIWFKPELVAAFEYAEWTPANHLRHSKFMALREDKDPKQVTRERPGRLIKNFEYSASTCRTRWRFPRTLFHIDCHFVRISACAIWCSS
jgi:hypothetical protein